MFVDVIFCNLQFRAHYFYYYVNMIVFVNSNVQKNVTEQDVWEHGDRSIMSGVKKKHKTTVSDTTNSLHRAGMKVSQSILQTK